MINTLKHEKKDKIPWVRFKRPEDTRKLIENYEAAEEDIEIEISDALKMLMMKFGI